MNSGASNEDTNHGDHCWPALRYRRGWRHLSASHPNYQAPRSWAEQAYHKLIYYNKVGRGGHYAAWEQPQLFSEEVRAGFRPLRK